MRSSKSRSRSKQNRPRTLGNIINRVFDSSGPEGKVRGTPQQIIEKYQLLARDAQLSNDRVAAENFLQHAEHYTRLLAEATREMQAEQEARQQVQQNSGNGQRDRNDRADYRGDPGGDAQPYAPAAEGFDVVGGDDDGNLVELPEAPRAQTQQPRRDDRNRDQQRRDDRPRDDRPRDDQRRDQRRDDRPRDQAARDQTPREDRPRDQAPRDQAPRDQAPREQAPRDRAPRDTRRREPEAQAELPAFITSPVPLAETKAPAAKAAPEPQQDPKPEPAAEPVIAEVAVKPARAPRVRKPAAPKAEAAKPDAPEAAE